MPAPPMPAAIKPLPSPPGRDPSLPSPRRLILFAFGLVVATVGLIIMRSGHAFAGLALLSRSVPIGVTHGDAVLVGGLIALAGSLLAAAAARPLVPDVVGASPLPPIHLRASWIGMLTILVGMAAHVVLDVRLWSRQYTHVDAGLFVMALALVAFAVTRFDPGDRARPLGLKTKDLAAVAAVVAGTIAVNTIELTRWDFAWIGDEGAFFIFGREIATTARFNPFVLRGVYDTHPVLDSLYQGAVMRLIGTDIIGWRMSEVLLLAVSAAMMYGLGALTLGRQPALIAATWLGTNHYLMAFARIAYNNLHVVFWTTLVALLLAAAWQTQRACFAFAAGMALGFCLYTMQLALLMWPIVGIVLLSTLLHRPLRRALPGLLLLVAGFALVVTPALLTTTPDRVLEVARHNTQREMALVNPTLVFSVSLAQSLVSFWSNEQWYQHYVGGPLLDPISSLLALVGMLLGMSRLEARVPRLSVIWFLLGILMIALSSYAPGPSFTRLLFLAPAIALLGGLTVAAALRTLPTGRLPIDKLLIAVLIIAIPAGNVYQLLVVSPTRVPANRTTMLIKALAEHPNNSVVLLGQSPTPDANVRLAVSWYPWLRERYRYQPLEELVAGAREQSPGYPPIYLVGPDEQSDAPRVAATLGPGYRSLIDQDMGNRFSVRLFVPRRQAQ